MTTIENSLYGASGSDPTLLTPDEIYAIVSA